MKTAYEQQMQQDVQRINDFLHTLPKGSMPEGLREAQRYSLLAGGKRIRPVLCCAFARLFGMHPDKVVSFAAGIESIHTYSLIHDDLPCMDNDTLRRGRPSSHIKFGEDVALLAGDALLTDAFSLMAAVVENGIEADRVVQAIAAVALAAGAAGMAGGQYLDLAFTGTKIQSLDALRHMYVQKTGALIRVSCESGALLAGAGSESVGKAQKFGAHLGAAFQIVDDILNEVGSEAELGKPVGSDAALGKVTYPSILGIARSRELAHEEVQAAIAALEGYSGADADFLRDLALQTETRAK